MKSTLLAAAGQLNLNVEHRAKQGHHKQSVQLYSRDDVWPSLFLQRDILTEVSTGWRPLTSQARGAKQPLPEPDFDSPPITEDDIRLLQMRTSALSKPTVDITTTMDDSPVSLLPQRKMLYPPLTQNPAHPRWMKGQFSQLRNRSW